ncbi:MAG TPA: S41 family peptidase [Flavipsychrobacter sp.]|nr:S41 family peptidase [Flavipsychrobacter sp.]
MAFIKKIKKARGFLAGVILSGTVFLFIQAKTSDSYFEVSKNLEIYSTLFKELNTYYVDPIEPGKLVKIGIDAMLDNLDPYTNYITESDIEEYEFMTTGKYGGIGASMKRRGEDIYIGDVYEFSPAQKAGLHPGDLVVAIDNQPLKGKSIDDISVLLKGSPGTQVTLKVKDAFNNSVSEKILTRGEIELSSVPYAALVGPQNNIAYVKLTQFTEGCSRQVRNSLDSLKGVQPNLKGVILDLRNDPGGLLDEAIGVCNIFVDRGQLVVSTIGKMKDWNKEYTTPGSAWDDKIPLTVLVNHSSASASEIVAGTMQDLDRGVIIGERSYGKGLVQTTRPLGYNARLKLTTAKYYTPSGRCIQAIDYTHRNADGSVGNVPDSLKKAYKTKNGRTVLSGGGITPDIFVKDEPISQLAITLYTKNYFFDYATEYVHQHPTIASASSFSLTEAEFNEFAKWLEGKDYSYETETEEALDSLKATAIREKYYDASKSEFASLQAKLSHDKKQDLVKNKDEIKHFLENEIASRYYFLRGRIAQGLRNDNDFAKALDILGEQTEYKATLQGK